MGLSVLLVDDTESLRSILEESIRSMGHLVETRVSGEDAIKSVLKKNYDVVIMDFQMGGGS